MGNETIYDESAVGKRFWDTLNHNGWLIVIESDKPEFYDTYTMKFLLRYETLCFARVSTDRNGMDLDGHMGVLWIDAAYEYGSPYTYESLSEMIEAIECAESNLLTIGVPFTAGYRFHGEGVNEKQERNRKLREEWKLKEIEYKCKKPKRQ